MKKAKRLFFRIFVYKCNLRNVWNYVYNKEYLNLGRVFALKRFKVEANQPECSRLEQRSIINVLVAEKCKPCEIYRRMCNVYGEVRFNNFTNSHFLLNHRSISWIFLRRTLSDYWYSDVWNVWKGRIGPFGESLFWLVVCFFFFFLAYQPLLSYFMPKSVIVAEELGKYI